MDKNTLSHTAWECKYHIVFAPKFRRQIIYGNIKADVANILSTLCKRKGIEIIEAECCKDHVHMLVRIPPNMIQEMHSNGLSLLRDANILFCCIKEAWSRGVLTGQDDGAFSDEQIGWDTLEPYGPDGACAGWDLSFLAGVPACDC